MEGKRPHLIRRISVVLLFGSLVLVGSMLILPPGKQLIEPYQPGLYKVSRFIDGDTIEVDMLGRPEIVRFIGVDTPETHKPHTPVQCYGPVAAAQTKHLIGTHKVRLQSDKLSTNRDRYGRLLRYVYLPDNTLVNKALIQSGHGFHYPYFPYTKSAEFKNVQVSARRTHIGLWASCHPIKRGEGFISNIAS